MRFSSALKNRYADEGEILNLSPEQFQAYIENLQKQYAQKQQQQQEYKPEPLSPEVSKQLQEEMGTSSGPQFAPLPPEARQKLIDEGYLPG